MVESGLLKLGLLCLGSMISEGSLYLPRWSWSDLQYQDVYTRKAIWNTLLRPLKKFWQKEKLPEV